MADARTRNLRRTAAERARTRSRRRGPNRCAVVLFPTYERPDLCLALLGDLERQRVRFDHVVVLDDASTADYGPVREKLRALGGRYLRWDERRGKRRYYETVNRLLAEAAALEATEIFFLADDMRLAKRFFRHARETWDRITDPQLTVLNLHLDKNRVDSACWTNIQPHAAHGGIRSGWTDGIWMASRRLLELLPAVPPIPASRWKNAGGRRELSSGVWQAFSMGLEEKGGTIYQTERSLVVHVAAPSRMNTARRQHIAIPTHDFVDGRVRHRTVGLHGRVVASMATIPERRELLRATVASLLPQVDQLVVYLNYADAPTPPFLTGHPKIVTYRDDATGFGDLSDMGKLYPSPELRSAGYVLTVDDDLVYAGDYVDRLLHAYEIHERRAVVGYHGVELLEGALNDYYRHRRVHHCLHPVEESRWVHVLGTGALAFAPGLLTLPRDAESLATGRGMADVWFAAQAQAQGVPMRVIAHTGAELRQQPLPGDRSLFRRMKGQRGAHAHLLEPSWPWTLHRPAPSA